MKLSDRRKQAGLLPVRVMLCLGLLLMQTGIFAQSTDTKGKGKVSGKIAFADGKPASYATVSVGGRNSTFTSEQGYFELSGVEEGEQVITVSHVGFAAVKKTVRVTAGTKTAVDIVVEAGNAIGEVVVTASRKQESIDEVPSSVTILNRVQIEQQANINSSISSILGNLVPGLGVATNKATNSGQTMRGRSVLILVDGIPQSTPLLNGNRDIRSLDPSIIERIEVIKGATSIYGNGSAGGIINFITKTPRTGKAFSGQTEIAGNGNILHADNTMGYRFSQTFEGNIRRFSYVVNGTYNYTGVYKDGKGEVIAQDDGLGQNRLYNLYGKLAYRPTDQSELTFSYSLFSSVQKTDYINQPGKYGSSPAIGVKGEVPGEPAGTPHNHNTYLSYRNSALPFNTALDVTLYHHRFESMNRYVPSSTSFYGPGQTQIRSLKKGVRLNLNTPWTWGKVSGEVMYGLDFLTDLTDQVMTDGRVFVAEMDMINLAPYAQLKLDMLEHLVLKGGIRYENARVKVDDYNTIATGPDNEGSIFVKGGTIPYHAAMFNGGLRYSKLPWFNPFISFSQGFAINELGRIIRSADENTLAQLETDPIITNNYEAGFSSKVGIFSFTAAYYISTSRLGANLVDVGGYMKPERAPEKVHGFEVTAEARPSSKWTVGGSYAYVEGKAENEDGSWKYLSGMRIAAPKGTAYLYYYPSKRLGLQLFLLHTGKRDRFEPRSNGLYANSEGPVSAVNIVNLNTAYYLLPKLKLGLGIENLLNTAYYPSISQYRAFDAEYVRGNGARATISLTWNY